MYFFSPKAHPFLNPFSLIFHENIYETSYNNENKHFTIVFVKLFLITSILINFAFLVKDLFFGIYFKLVFFIMGIIGSCIIIILLKYISKYEKIYIDILLCILILGLFVLHCHFTMKKLINITTNPFIIFYMGIGIQTLNILLYVSKINWIFSITAGFIGYSINIYKFLDDPAFVNGLWVSLSVPILLCYGLLICICYIKEITERTQFYERKKAEEKLIMFEKLIKEVIPNQIIILNPKSPEIIFKNNLVSETFENKSEDTILEEILKFKIRDINQIDCEFSEFKDLYKKLRKKEFLPTDFFNFEAIYNKLEDESPGLDPTPEFERNAYYTGKIGQIEWGSQKAFLLILNDTSSVINFKKLKEIDEYKDILLATVSHDLRTPLAGIICMLQMVLESIDDEKIKKKINLALKSGKILTYMINDILDFSQISNKKIKLNLQPVLFEECVEDVIEITQFQANQKKIDFIVKMPSFLKKAKIIADPIRLKQILFNLLTNAIKFTSKGYVCLEIEKIQDNYLNDSVLKFKVKDTGIGIEPDNFDKIFTLFGKLKQNDPHINKNGVGLGLVISKDLAKMMYQYDKKGIHLQSKVGSGSEFWFKIQLEEENLQTSSYNELSNLIDSSFPYENLNTETSSPTGSTMKLSPKKRFTIDNYRILLVDDDAMNLIIHEQYLKSFYLAYDKANNGKEAIEIIEENKKKNIFYNLIIMDCNMPIMNGFQASKIIKNMVDSKFIPYVPILAVTANASIKEIEHCKKFFMEHYLAKPVQKNKMKEKIEEILKLKL